MPNVSLARRRAADNQRSQNGEHQEQGKYDRAMVRWLLRLVADDNPTLFAKMAAEVVVETLVV